MRSDNMRKLKQYKKCFVCFELLSFRTMSKGVSTWIYRWQWSTTGR